MIEDKTSAFAQSLSRLPRVSFLSWATPLESLPRLGRRLGVDLMVKRDDLTGIAFGGNKIRQLEFYFGNAVAAASDTVLITGAVQSNYVRAASACAARLGMACHVQLEERVPDVDAIHRSSGNVLLDELLGATLHSYPIGEDEAGADQQLREIAAELKSQGRNPYVIPLGADNPPLGALGYLVCAAELLAQNREFDSLVVASGSGHTHAGILFGLRALGWQGRVIGICVRRAALLQASRIQGHCERVAEMLGLSNPVKPADIEVYDDVLAPGYGLLNDQVAEAIRDCARDEGLMVDPVYTGRVMAGLFACARDGRLPAKAKTIFLHTGGLPALFGYETDLRRRVIQTKSGER